MPPGMAGPAPDIDIWHQPPPLIRHPRGGGDPGDLSVGTDGDKKGSVFSDGQALWIPAFAGMTQKEGAVHLTKA